MCDTGTWQVNTTLVSDRFTRPRYTTCLTGHLWHSTDCCVPGIPKSWQTKLPKKYLTVLTQVDDRPDPNYDLGKLYDTGIWHVTAQVWQVSAVQLWHVRQGRRAPGRLLHRPRFPKSWPGFEAAAVSPSQAVGRTPAFHFLKVSILWLMWWSSSSYKWLLTLQSKFSFISTEPQTNVLVKVFSLGTAFREQTCSCCCLSSMIWFQLLSKTLWKSSSPSTSSSLKMCSHHLSIPCLIRVTRYQYLVCVPFNSLK